MKRKSSAVYLSDKRERNSLTPAIFHQFVLLPFDLWEVILLVSYTNYTKKPPLLLICKRLTPGHGLSNLAVREIMCRRSTHIYQRIANVTETEERRKEAWWYAASSGDIDFMNKLENAGFTLNECKCPMIEFVLITACRAGRLATVQHLTLRNKEAVIANKNLLTAMMQTCCYHQPEKTDLLRFVYELAGNSIDFYSTNYLYGSSRQRFLHTIQTGLRKPATISALVAMRNNDVAALENLATLKPLLTKHEQYSALFNYHGAPYVQTGEQEFISVRDKNIARGRVAILDTALKHFKELFGLDRKDVNKGLLSSVSEAINSGYTGVLEWLVDNKILTQRNAETIIVDNRSSSPHCVLSMEILATRFPALASLIFEATLNALSLKYNSIERELQFLQRLASEHDLSLDFKCMRIAANTNSLAAVQLVHKYLKSKPDRSALQCAILHKEDNGIIRYLVENNLF